MTDHRVKRKIIKPRFELTDKDLQRFSETILTKSVPELVQQTGLPYMLIYNIIHRRVKTVSTRHYRMLFGESPPMREPKKIDASMFRGLVELWLYLNDDITKSDLYRELLENRQTKKVDYRIFTGQIKTVEPRLERLMRKKFFDVGFDQPILVQWLEDMANIGREDRIPYERVRPILVFLHNELGVHPTRILNQSFHRYETGLLKHVSRSKYEHAVRLKEKVEKTTGTTRGLEIEKIKEEIYTGKPDYVLYAEVEEELRFLVEYAERSAKKYLGRGMGIYAKKKAKRIASWRADKIFADCDRFILKTPTLRLSALPRSRQKFHIQKFIEVLILRTTRMLSEIDGVAFEKQILMPLHSRDEYRKLNHGFTRFDMVPSALKMKRRAFDLMVAKNCELFKDVGRYDNRWYLSDLYLKELSENSLFELVSAKYEIMAKEMNLVSKSNDCMH